MNFLLLSVLLLLIALSSAKRMAQTEDEFSSEVKAAINTEEVRTTLKSDMTPEILIKFCQS